MPYPNTAGYPYPWGGYGTYPGAPYYLPTYWGRGFPYRLVQASGPKEQFTGWPNTYYGNMMRQRATAQVNPAGGVSVGACAWLGVPNTASHEWCCNAPGGKLYCIPANKMPPSGSDPEDPAAPRRMRGAPSAPPRGRPVRRNPQGDCSWYNHETGTNMLWCCQHTGANVCYPSTVKQKPRPNPAARMAQLAFSQGSGEPARRRNPSCFWQGEPGTKSHEWCCFQGDTFMCIPASKLPSGTPVPKPFAAGGSYQGAPRPNPADCFWHDSGKGGMMWCCEGEMGKLCWPADLLPPGTPIPKSAAPGLSFSPTGAPRLPVLRRRPNPPPSTEHVGQQMAGTFDCSIAAPGHVQCDFHEPRYAAGVAPPNPQDNCDIQGYRELEAYNRRQMLAGRSMAIMPGSNLLEGCDEATKRREMARMDALIPIPARGDVHRRLSNPIFGLPAGAVIGGGVALAGAAAWCFGRSGIVSTESVAIPNQGSVTKTISYGNCLEQLPYKVEVTGFGVSLERHFKTLDEAQMFGEDDSANGDGDGRVRNPASDAAVGACYEACKGDFPPATDTRGHANCWSACVQAAGGWPGSPSSPLVYAPPAHPRGPGRRRQRVSARMRVRAPNPELTPEEIEYRRQQISAAQRFAAINRMNAAYGLPAQMVRGVQPPFPQPIPIGPRFPYSR